MKRCDEMTDEMDNGRACCKAGCGPRIIEEMDVVQLQGPQQIFKDYKKK